MILDQDPANPKSAEEWQSFYRRIRERTEDLASPLEKEDYVIQAATFASPTKWHLAHVSWFFQDFILRNKDEKFKPLNEFYSFLFNSYYQTVGLPWERHQRGVISRPTVDEVYQFRKFIDEHMLSLLDSSSQNEEVRLLTHLGGNHEQQHQELQLTDIKYNLSINPMKPTYRKTKSVSSPSFEEIPPLDFVSFKGGVVEVGHNDRSKFAFDNEMPVNKIYLNDYKLANRLITNGEYLEFIESGGYTDHRYWLADAWHNVKTNNWKAPLHWHLVDGEWHTYTLSGLKPVNLSEPVTHVSYYEADAYSKWRGARDGRKYRLPLEGEWETAVRSLNLTPREENFVENNLFHPRPIDLERLEEEKVAQMYGDVWEWTCSPYIPYPGFNVLAEGVSEYNGKFMNAQWVLKGGSCATPVDHIRPTYRNFFYGHEQWQFTGIRLAE